ncbi:MAG: hypothetical protein WA130_00315 [Candidatus Methanoperedens sp.]
MKTTREILAKYLPERILDNPVIKDGIIKAMEEIVKERKHEITSIGKDKWKIEGDRGPYPYQWVKLGGEKYPQKWVFRNLLGITEPDSFNQQYAEDFFKALGLETRD